MTKQIIRVDWDSRILIHNGARFYLRVHSGVTIHLKNWMQAHTSMGFGSETASIEAEIARCAPMGELKPIDFDSPSALTPEQIHMDFHTQRGDLHVALVWGIALTGAKRRHQQIGNFYCIVCHADQTPSVLKHLFNQESA